VKNPARTSALRFEIKSSYHLEKRLFGLFQSLITLLLENIIL